MMKRLWWRFLDYFWPRWVLACDPAADGMECTVTAIRQRDGVLRIVKIEHHDNRKKA